MPDPIQPTGPSVKIGQTRATLPNHPANQLVNPTADTTTGALWTQTVDPSGDPLFSLLNPGEVTLVGGVVVSGTVTAEIPDGDDVTEGSVADVAVQGDVAGTVSAKLRGLNKSIAAGLTVNAGTNLNTSLLALESGGNLATLAGIVSSSKAAIKSADGDQVSIGAKADPPATTATTDPWTVISLLKGIFAKLLSGLGVTFTNTTIAVTQGTAANLNATVTGSVSTSGNDLVDAGNSTTTPLGNSGVFTGTSHSTIGFAALALAIDADVVSANNGVVVQWSEDGANWGDYDTNTFDTSDTGGVQQTFIFPVKRQYYRVLYTANAAQSYFRLQSVLKVAPINGATAQNAGTSSAATNRVVLATAAVLNVTQASVLVTSTPVIAANANRIKCRVINTSTNPLWIGPTNPATVGNGAYIPGIAGYPWTTRYEGALFAIATGGTALVTVDEESAS